MQTLLVRPDFAIGQIETEPPPGGELLLPQAARVRLVKSGTSDAARWLGLLVIGPSRA